MQTELKTDTSFKSYSNSKNIFCFFFCLYASIANGKRVGEGSGSDLAHAIMSGHIDGRASVVGVAQYALRDGSHHILVLSPGMFFRFV